MQERQIQDYEYDYKNRCNVQNLNFLQIEQRIKLVSHTPQQEGLLPYIGLDLIEPDSSTRTIFVLHLYYI